MLSLLSAAWLALVATPVWAGLAPDVRLLPTPRSTKITNNNCSSLRNLVTITRTVQNYGGYLPAHRDYLYVSEVSKFYSGGKVDGAHLHSGRVYIPAMREQGLGKPVTLTLVVGTEAFYANRVAGPHVLMVHLVDNGNDIDNYSTLGDPISSVKFPPGYCQPRSVMPRSQLHMQRKPAPLRGFGSGGQRVARLGAGASASMHPTLHIPPPKIRLVSETPYVHLGCKNMNDVVTFRLRLRNEGGPLAAHKLEAWIEDDKLVLPYNGVAHEKWIPPMMSGQTVNMMLPVGVLQRNIGQLPGRHSLAIRYYTGAVLATGVRAIARKRVSIMLPEGICQPTMRVMPPAQMRLKRQMHLKK